MVSDSMALGCCGSMIAVWLLLTTFWVLFRAGKNRWEMDCPECIGGEKRPWGPCPTCGPEGTIDVRSNGVPHGRGTSGAYDDVAVVHAAARTFGWTGRKK